MDEEERDARRAARTNGQRDYDKLTSAANEYLIEMNRRPVAMPSVIQRLAEHSQVSMTARYDRRGEEAKRMAVELLQVPYIG